MAIIFDGVRLINPAESIDSLGCVRISHEGVITDIRLGRGGFAQELAQTDDLIYDFTHRGGEVLFASGLFDMHCHFRQPGFEYKETLETGKNAAIAGGFTGVALMPNTEPPIDNAQNAAFIYHLTHQFPIETSVIGAITEGRKGQKICGYGDLSTVGVTAISDDGSPVMNSRTMRMAFEYATAFDMLVIQHCEDTCLAESGVMNEGVYSSILGLRGIPSISESIILSRDLSLLRYLSDKKKSVFPNAPRYHVAHISTAEGIKLVKEAKSEGLCVTAEVTPHHFTLTERDVFESGFDGNFRMNPPLRSERDKEAILEAIETGVIDVIATDHAPHAPHEKECGIMQAAFGIVGLETAVGLSWTELHFKRGISHAQIVSMLSSAPRALLKLPAISFRKGALANFSLIDTAIEYLALNSSFQSKSKNSPFNGRKLRGKAIAIGSKGVFLKDDTLFSSSAKIHQFKP
ncbi:MAG: dihydroorotase [Chloroherpetonaceae bacterium]|nr:dihydroorotase [Chloroherpetonaceae bacterium]